MTTIRVIDFESTGSAPPAHGLCEIGYTDLVSTMMDLTERPCGWEVAGEPVAILANPGRAIPPITAAVHHIIDEDVRTAPHWRAVLRSVMTSIASVPGVIAIAAHGAEHEQAWFDDDLPCTLPWIDTYKVALRFWPQAVAHSNQGLRYWRMPRGLDRTVAHPTHRAGPDSYVTAHILRDMLNLGCSLDQMLAWSAEMALPVRCYLGDYRNDGEGTPWPEVESSMLRWILDRPSMKPEVRNAAQYHLDRRAAQVREIEERDALNNQLVSAGLPPEPQLTMPSPAQQMQEPFL